MSTQANPAAGQPVPMSLDELKALMAQTAKESVGPVVAAALEPHNKAHTEQLSELKAALARRDDTDKPEFDRKAVLGKSHFGTAARVMAMATIENGSKDIGAAEFAIKRDWPLALRERALKWTAHVKTTLAAGNGAVAGDIIIPDFDPEWIELLRNNAVVRGLPGIRVKSMPRGAITQRKQTGAATAAYQGELGPTTPSNLTVGKTEMSYKKLRALTVVSNDEIRFGGPEVDSLVQSDLLQVSALREDRAFLVGNPPTDAGSPQGIRFQTLAANVSASSGTSLANFQSDLTAMIRDVQKRNLDVTPANSNFIMSVSTFWTIYALTTTTGDWVFKAGLDMAQPTILGFPVRLSTQLEVTNSFIGASSGLVFFTHNPSLVIWDAMSRMVEVFRGGAYRDENATIQSGISNDETVIVCTAEHDFQQRYQEAASIRTGYAT